MEVQNLEQLPAAFNYLIAKTLKIEELLMQRSAPIHVEQPYMVVEQVADLLHLSPTSIYKLVQQKQIPYSKIGRRLYFSKSDLLQWVETGKRDTVKQLEKTAESTFCSAYKKRIL